MKGKHKVLLFLLLIGISHCFFTSCNVNKHLKPNEYLITSNEIILEDKEDVIKEKGTMKYELSKLVQQEVNTKLLWFFRPEVKWHYTSKPIDRAKIESDKWSERVSGKFHRWFLKKFTEEPVLYDTLVMNVTTAQMENYLHNRGYFDATVRAEEKLLDRRKKAVISYIVNPGSPYKIDSILYESNDPELEDKLSWLSQDTYYKHGNLIDLKVYNQEVARVTDSLRNKGYAYFFPSYVQSLETDTTGGSKKLKIYSKINKPADEPSHEKFFIGQINLYPNYKGKDSNSNAFDTLIDGIHYKTADGIIGVKAKVLRKNIFLNSGDLFQQDLIKKTNTQLGALGVYKFINVVQKKSSLKENHIDFDIYLSKAKKQSINFQADINNSQRTLEKNTSISSFLGTVANVSYRNRNTFRGAENIGLTIEGGLEFNLENNDTLINSSDFLGRFDILLPEFIDIPGSLKILSLIKFGNFSVLNRNFYSELKEKGKPIGTISYNLFNLKDFYSYRSIEGSWGYELRRSAREQYRINTIGLTLFRANISPLFEGLFDQNPFLEKVFQEDQLFTGLLFSKFNYIWTGPVSKFGESWQIRFNQEVSGIEAFVVNRIVHKGKKPFDLPGGINFSHFLKGDIDIRYFKKYNDGNILGIKASAGLAVPFGGDSLSVAVPFVKQFSVGGPNSIRAWRIRELGPGEHFDPSIIDPPYFQTGDVKLDFSLEYRFKFIPFFALDGAVFLDGGNVWTLREDPARLGSQLRWRSYLSPNDPSPDPEPIGGNFISQLALGTGFGLRMDFTYVILRFDVGLKLRSPFELASGSHWYVNQWNINNRKDILNYNLALGYPF